MSSAVRPSTSGSTGRFGPSSSTPLVATGNNNTANPVANSNASTPVSSSLYSGPGAGGASARSPGLNSTPGLNQSGSSTPVARFGRGTQQLSGNNDKNNTNNNNSSNNANPNQEVTDFSRASAYASGRQRPAFDAMHYYLKNAKDAVFVSLQGYMIDDLLPYIGGLRQLSNMKSLSLAHNQLDKLPEDLSFMLNLETIDLTDNRFTKASAVLKGLFSVPNLKNLRIILPEEEEEQIVATLPLLESLNGVQLVDPEAEAEAALRNEGEDDDAIPLDPADELRKFKQSGGYPTRDGIGKQYGFVPWTTEHSNDFRRAFEDAARAGGSLATGMHEFEELHRAVVTHMRSRYRSEADIIKAQLLKLNASSIMMEFCFDEAVRSSARYNKDLAQALRTMCDKNAEILQLASSIVAATQDDRQEKFLAMQADVARMAKEIERLRRENISAEKRAREKIRAAGGFGGGGGDEDDRDAVGGEGGRGSGGGAGVGQQQALASAERDFVRDIFASFKSSTATLSELKSTIRDVFVSKQKQDALHLKSRLPKETLEQHVFTYFINKQTAGNRDTVRSTVEGFFKSVYAHKSVDLDVSVFDQIINCEIDEAYWYEHQKLNATVYDAIYSALLAEGGRVPRPGSEPGGADGVDGYLDENQCRKILGILVPKNESSPTTVSAIMRASIIEMRRSFDPSIDKIPRIGYQAFARFVLMSFVAARRRAIEPVVAALHSIDPDRNGVFDQAQIRSVMDKVIPGSTPREQHYVTQILDPNGHHVILFSDIVRELCGLIPAEAGSGQLPSVENQRKKMLDRFKERVKLDDD